MPAERRFPGCGRLWQSPDMRGHAAKFVAGDHACGNGNLLGCSRLNDGRGPVPMPPRMPPMTPPRCRRTCPPCQRLRPCWLRRRFFLHHFDCFGNLGGAVSWLLSISETTFTGYARERGGGGGGGVVVAGALPAAWSWPPWAGLRVDQRNQNHGCNDRAIHHDSNHGKILALGLDLPAGLHQMHLQTWPTSDIRNIVTTYRHRNVEYLFPRQSLFLLRIANWLVGQKRRVFCSITICIRCESLAPGSPSSR